MRFDSSGSSFPDAPHTGIAFTGSDRLPADRSRARRKFEIGEGADVALAAAGDGVYAIWSTPTGIRALLPGAKESIAIAPDGKFPAIAALPNGQALAAWENEGRIEIQPVNNLTAARIVRGAAD